MRISELLPVTPTDKDLYMHNLYARKGLELGSTGNDVLAVAYLNWGVASDGSSRIEAAELLLGRRIDDQEFNVLPAAFKQHLFGAGDFDALLSVASRIAEVERT